MPAHKSAHVTPRDIRGYGYVPDLPDHRDLTLADLLPPGPAPLPAAVDLRDKCPPVMNQGDLGSCTAHGTTGAMRHALVSAGLPDKVMSRLQLYYDSRLIEGTVQADAGAQIRDVIKSAAVTGVGLEKTWPYQLARFRKKPSKATYTEAKLDVALKYARVDISPVAIKVALANGFAVIIGISVFESFESDETARTGFVTMPTKAEKLLGGHCLYVVGYGQKPGYFTVRNSWGTEWGDKGDCYIPEAYLGDANLGADYWVIQAVGKAA